MVKIIKEEQLKLDKDGLDVYNDIFRYASLGYSAIEEGDLKRFKWFGIYAQKPNEGHFMVRIKIAGGQLSPAQLRCIAGLSRDFGLGLADITTRQTIQLHWLTIENLPTLIDQLHAVGLYLNTACGDAPRNMVACPLAGVMKDELFDCSHLAWQVSDMYRDAGKEFSNLPRKFKMSISACPIHCTIPQIHCLSLFGVRRADGSVGYGVCVGGGLRNTPHIGQSLRVFIPAGQDKTVLDVYRAVAAIFRDADSLRQNRLKARLKFLVADMGWQAFRDRLEQTLGYAVEHDESIDAPHGATKQDHLGHGEQKDGLYFMGIPVPRGRVNDSQLTAMADLAERYAESGRAAIRLTPKQNAILLNIPKANLPDLAKALSDIGLPPYAHALRGALLSCTGTQFCNLAVVETKQRAADILAHLEQTVDIDEPLFISVTGCPNSCSQYQIADIGLTGVLMNWGGQPRQDGYHVLLGARLGAEAEFGEFVTDAAGKKLKLPSAEAHVAIEQLLKAYKAEAVNEGFDEFVRRTDMPQLAQWLTTPAMAAAAAAGAAGEAD